MTDSDKKRLNEIGEEIAKMFPNSNGSIAFDYSNGKLQGIRADAKWRPEKIIDPQVLQKGNSQINVSKK